MNLRLVFLLSILSGVFLPQASYTQTDSIPLVEIDHFFERIGMNPILEVFEDSSGQSQFDVEWLEQQTYIPRDSLEYPRDFGHKLWARFRMVHHLEEAAEFVLYTYTGDRIFLHIGHQGDWQKLESGYYSAPSDRTLSVGEPHSFVFKLVPGKEYMFYLEVYEEKGTGSYMGGSLYPYSYWAAYFYKTNFNPAMLLSFFFGVVTIVMLYNLIVYISIRERSYLYYCLYLLFLLVAGYMEMMAPMFPTFAIPQYTLSTLISDGGLNMLSFFYLLFGRYFINSWELTPKWDKVLQGLMGLRLLTLVYLTVMLTTGESENTVMSIVIGQFGLELAVLLPYFVVLLRTGSRVARFFIAGSVFVFGLGFFTLLIERFADNPMGRDSLTYLIGSFLMEILVFSVGLGYKIRKQQRDKLDAEQALNQELSKVNSAFGRFVPHEFIQSLGHNSVLDVKLGDQVEKEVTVLFSDIRGYTTLSEQMSPEENFRFLNAYLGRMGPLIQEHGGFVNQYYGDGIMALFLKEPAEALYAAADMLKELQPYNAEREAKGRMPIQLGIGLHTGSLMMGIIGDQLRMEAGVVSDTVNTASRMEGLTKFFGVKLLLSESCYKKLGQEARAMVRPLGRVLVKGRKTPIAIFDCFAGDPEPVRKAKLRTQAGMTEGLEAYLAGDFAQSQAQLEAVISLFPGDKAAQFYLSQSKKYLTEGTPENWAGVEIMAFK